jgi:hypothetical protein
MNYLANFRSPGAFMRMPPALKLAQTIVVRPLNRTY